MVQCCVPFCKSRQDSPGKYAFHEFPVTNVRFEWLRRIARKAEGGTGTQWVPSDRSKVCSRHFRQEDYRPDVKIRLLRPDAVPSIFPPPTPSPSGPGGEGQRRKRGRPSVDSGPVNTEVPQKGKPVSPRKKLLRLAKVQQPAANTKAANKRSSPSQRPSQKPLAPATCSSVQPAPSPLKNLIGLQKAGPKKRRAACSSSGTDRTRVSSGPVVVRARAALNAGRDPSPPNRIRVPSILRVAPGKLSLGSATSAPPCGLPQAASSPTLLGTRASASQTSVSASQTNVAVSKTGTLVLQTGTSAFETNVPVLQTSVSAPQTAVPASQAGASASQNNLRLLRTSVPALQSSMSASQNNVPTSRAGTSASQNNVPVLQTSVSASETGLPPSQKNVSGLQTDTSAPQNVPVSQAPVPASQTSMSAPQNNAPALQTGTSASQNNASSSDTGTPSPQTSVSAPQTTSGATLQPLPNRVVCLVVPPKSPAVKGLLSPALRSQVRIVVPGAAASKPLLVSLKCPPKVIAATATEPAKGDPSPLVQPTLTHLNNQGQQVRPPERHVRTWGSQTRLTRQRLRHLCQRFRTAQRKCLKLQADRKRLQAELAAASLKARQAQAFVKQLKLNRFQEGLSRGDPRCLFLEEQLRSLGQSKHRWREDTLQSCLHWHALAPRGYRLIAQSGLLALPSGSTLKRHVHGTASATARNPPSPTGDTLPDSIDWEQIECSGGQESSGQQPANGYRPVTGQPGNNAQSEVEVVVTTEEVPSSSSVVLNSKDVARAPARVDGASQEARAACSDFNLVPASSQRPANSTDAESRLPQSVVKVVVSSEKVVSSSSVALDNADGADIRLQKNRASPEARVACSDFTLVPAATISNGNEQLRVIYVTVPTSNRDLFTADTVLSPGIAVLPASRGTGQPLMCSPSVRTESSILCSPSAEYIDQAEGAAEEQLLENDLPPKDLAELLNIVGAEPSQMKRL